MTWFIIAIIAIPTSLLGILVNDLYVGVMSKSIIPGAVAQDLVVFISSLALLFGTIYMQFSTENHLRLKILNIGIVGFYCYAYGIYVIEQVYITLYLSYLLILSLSIYSLIFGIIEISREMIPELNHSKKLRNSTIFYQLLNPIIFYPLWLSQLIPLLIDSERVENLFSIYIIDLVFIMPAFLILAYLYYYRNPLGFIGTPVIFIVGFGILSPLAIGEIMKLVLYNLAPDWFSFILFLTLSTIFGFLAYLHLRQFHKID